MFDLTQTSQYGLYFVLVAGIIVLPGMDMAFVMASALVDGRKAGGAAVAGIVAGGVIHVAMGALGVGLVLLSAPRLFNALLTAGALYVAWLGWSLLRGGRALDEVHEHAGPPQGRIPECEARRRTDRQVSRPLWSTFGRAVLTCLLNPKAYVFMLAVFPQFLRTEYGPIVAQAMALAAITSFTQALVYGGVAAGAARLRGWLRANARAQVSLGRAVGVLLLLMAAWTACQGWQTGH